MGLSRFLASWIDNMLPALAFVIAGMVSLPLTPLIVPFASRWKLFDLPDG